MNLFLDKKDCSGCTACKNICPKNAITMIYDKQGFEYPTINDELCINCGICKKSCRFNEKSISNKNLDDIKVYAVKHKSENIRKKSSSGGFFTVISDYILSKNGVVYGAGFDKNFNVIHKSAINSEERDELRGSKYVQSQMKETFKCVEKDLKEDKYVIFTGTPCQVAGLQGYLKKDYGKLIKCDIICHGTPSVKVFNDYKEFMEDKYKSKIKSFNFRSKSIIGEVQVIEIIFENNKIYRKPIHLDPYGKLFFENYTLKPSCYNCKFTNLNRTSDFTMADFWGIEKSIPDFDDKKGVSLVLVNTNRGKEIFNSIKNSIIYVESNITDCMQHNLQNPSDKPKILINFWNDYNSNGFLYVAKKYGGYNFIDKSKRECRKRLSLILKKFGIISVLKKIKTFL